MRGHVLGRLAAACLVLGAIAPAGAVAASDPYFDGALSSGYGNASVSAHSGVYYSEGRADHNAFCAGVSQGSSGTVYALAFSAPVACASSGGAAIKYYSPALSGYHHGAVRTDYGYSFAWDFTSATHYSW